MKTTICPADLKSSYRKAPLMIPVLNRIGSAYKRLFLTLACLLIFLSSFTGFAADALAVTPTDEIEHFLITVDVQDDASLRMTYHIDWKVLDDQIYGPLTWVDIGLPNSHHSEVAALSDNISHIEDNGSSLAVYLDRSYYKDETASFEFSFIQDHMYQIDRYATGETVFAYTPAWFDEIGIDDLTIRWNSDKAGAWQPDCIVDNGYLVFSTALSPGERYSITVAYPNDAFGFSVDRQSDGGYDGFDDDYDDGYDDGYGYNIGYDDGYGYDYGRDRFPLFGGISTLLIFFGLPLVLFFKFLRWINDGTGFGSDDYESSAPKKKITRTKIEYYENCPGCGAVRQEGKDECPYCGHSMIKSKEIIEEKDLERPQDYSKNGTYRYGSSPNTFIHVNVVNIPPARPSGHRHTGGRHGSGGGSRPRSSCACASACASSCSRFFRSFSFFFSFSFCFFFSSSSEFFKESIHRGRVRVEQR